MVGTVIDKSDIAVCRSLQGRTNANTLVLFDVSYAPGAVIFLEFCGAIDLKDHRYRGALHFDENRTGETRTFDSIPGLEAATPSGPLPDVEVEIDAFGGRSAAEVDEVGTEEVTSDGI